MEGIKEYIQISLDSDSEDECIICFEPFKVDDLYVTINNPGENAKFHFACIEQWLKKSNHGIMTQQPITQLHIGNQNCTKIEMSVLLPDKVNEEEDDYCDCVIS